MSVERFAFEWDRVYQLAGLPVGVTPWTAYVDLSPAELSVRFGPWRLKTALGNIAGTALTGGYGLLRTVGPPHLSLVDHGITFATNGRRGLCVQLREPVRGIDPTGLLKHPGVTLTVADPDALAAALGRPLTGRAA